MVSYLSKRLKRIQERICFTKTELFLPFYKIRNRLWVWHNTENGWWTKRQIQWWSVYHVWKHPFITLDNSGCTMHAKTNPSITIQTLNKISYLLGTKKVEKYTFSNICRDRLIRKLQEIKYWFHKHLQQISALSHHQTWSIWSKWDSGTRSNSIKCGRTQYQTGISGRKVHYI